MHGAYEQSVGSTFRGADKISQVLCELLLCMQIRVGDVVSVRLDSRSTYSFSGYQHDLWVVNEIFLDIHVRCSSLPGACMRCEHMTGFATQSYSPPPF